MMLALMTYHFFSVLQGSETSFTLTSYF